MNWNQKKKTEIRKQKLELAIFTLALLKLKLEKKQM